MFEGDLPPVLHLAFKLIEQSLLVHVLEAAPDRRLVLPRELAADLAKHTLRVFSQCSPFYHLID